MNQLLEKKVEEGPPTLENKSKEEKAVAWKRILGMILIIADNCMMTVSYTITKTIFKQNDRFSTFEVFAARTIGQFICQETYNYFVNRSMKKN